MRRYAVASLVVMVVGVLAASAAANAPLTVCPSGCAFTSIAAAVGAAGDGDRIVVEAGTYVGGVTIDDDITLVGAGADATVVTVGPSPTVEFALAIGAGSSVKLRDFSIDAHPLASPSIGLSSAGTSTLTRVVVHSANSVFGAGIVNDGEMTLRDVVVQGNFADVGGGVRNSGTLTVQNSTIAENGAGLVGGGIVNSGTLTVRHTTISDNTADVSGGGILNQGGSVSLSNVTFAGNTPNDCEAC